MKKQFRSFEDARKFVHSLKLKNREEWRKYSKSGKKPEDIPTNPDKIYKKEWISSGDWIGTDFISLRKRSYRNFQEARDYVHSLNLKDIDDWRKFAKSSQKPKDIPHDPIQVYKKEWKSVGDWLGTGSISTSKMIFRNFEDARKFVHQLGIKKREDWEQYRKSVERPVDIPSNPNITYKNKGWINFGDWVGSGKISNQTASKNYLPLNEARTVVRQLAKKYNLKTFDDWEKAYREGKIPKNIPMQPNRVYSKKRKK